MISGDHRPQPNTSQARTHARTRHEGIVGLLRQRVVKVPRQELGGRGVALHQGRAQVHDDVGARLLCVCNERKSKGGKYTRQIK